MPELVDRDWLISRSRHLKEIHTDPPSPPPPQEPARPKVYFDFLWQGRLRMYYGRVVFFQGLLRASFEVADNYCTMFYG